MAPAKKAAKKGGRKAAKKGGRKAAKKAGRKTAKKGGTSAACKIAGRRAMHGGVRRRQTRVRNVDEAVVR